LSNARKFLERRNDEIETFDIRGHDRAPCIVNRYTM
jgi:hypothetical protein